MIRWIRQTLRGLRALVRRRDEMRDLDDELREYLAESVDAKVAAGLDRAEALRVAR